MSCSRDLDRDLTTFIYRKQESTKTFSTNSGINRVLREKMVERGWHFELTGKDDTRTCIFWKDDSIFKSTSESETMAVAKAALKALRSEIPNCDNRNKRAGL